MALLSQWVASGGALVWILSCKPRMTFPGIDPEQQSGNRENHSPIGLHPCDLLCHREHYRHNWLSPREATGQQESLADDRNEGVPGVAELADSTQASNLGTSDIPRMHLFQDQLVAIV